MTLASTPDLTTLRAVDGLHFPGEPGYDHARLAWNLIADQHPTVIAVPESIDGETMRPWADCAPYLNFIDAPLDAATAFDPETLERLHRVRAQYDPDRVWLAAHALPEVEAV